MLLLLSQFFHTGHAKDNKALVEMLRHQGVIKSGRVMETMEGIDRKLFAPQGIHSPYVDSPLITPGQIGCVTFEVVRGIYHKSIPYFQNEQITDLFALTY